MHNYFVEYKSVKKVMKSILAPLVGLKNEKEVCFLLCSLSFEKVRHVFASCFVHYHLRLLGVHAICLIDGRYPMFANEEGKDDDDIIQMMMCEACHI